MFDEEFLTKLANEKRLSPTQIKVFVAKFVDSAPGAIPNDYAVSSKVYLSEKTVTNCMSAIYKNKFYLTEKGPGKAHRLYSIIEEEEKRYLQSGEISEEQIEEKLLKTKTQQSDSLAVCPLLSIDRKRQRSLKRSIDNYPPVRLEKERIERAESLKEPTPLDVEVLKQVRKQLPYKKKIAIISKELSLSERTVNRFFDCEAIERDDFVRICESLEVIWHFNADRRFSEIVQDVVPSIKEAVNYEIKDKCSRLRILDVEREIDVDDLYVSVNILKNLTKHSRHSISEFRRVHNPKTGETNRSVFGQIGEAGVPGDKAAEEYKTMMIFGKPGAGKTTFLKHIAIRCNDDDLFPHSIPVFIGLKKYVDRNKPNSFSIEKEVHTFLHAAIEQGLDIKSGNKVIEMISEIIEHGRLLVLLDGLDEVPPEYKDDIATDIENLRSVFRKNRIIITCRIAAIENGFEGFRAVEVADFNPSQIKDFVRKWFAYSLRNSEDEALATSNKFIENIESHKYAQIRELAVTPILLVLACLVFQEKKKFPETRHSLYKSGIDILLNKWDRARRIENRSGSLLYKNMPIEKKREIFNFVAASTFQKTEYYFDYKRLRHLIAEYMRSYITDEKRLVLGEEKLDSIISTIAAQHGLIIERAYDVLSFSHLTFQEYFAAEYIVDNRDSELSKKMLPHITDTRYLEVYLLAAEMLGTADSLLLERKSEIDAKVASDSDLVEFLKWLERKASDEKQKKKNISLRAFYFDCYMHKIGWEGKTENKLTRTVEKTFLQALSGKRGRTHLNLRSDYMLIDVMKLIRKSRPPYDSVAETTYSNLIEKLTGALNLSRDSDFRKDLNSLMETLPSEGSDFHNWWHINCKSWTRDFYKITRAHRLLGKDWRFKKKQNQLLVDYYHANVGLLNCLATTALVTNKVREKLNDTILLPFI